MSDTQKVRWQQWIDITNVKPLSVPRTTHEAHSRPEDQILINRRDITSSKDAWDMQEFITRMYIKQLLRHPAFQLLLAMLLVVNAITIAIRTNSVLGQHPACVWSTAPSSGPTAHQKDHISKEVAPSHAGLLKTDTDSTFFIKERSKVNAVPLKNKKASSFHEFARNTSDAWDIGDDEEEDFSSPSFQTLNSKVALATAAQVLENHSKLRVKPERSQSTTSEVPANYKVIKSSSDAQLSRNSSDTCLRNPLHKQQSLPLRPIIPLVARISDQNASGAPPMTVREKTRLEKFRQLLSSHNTDLDELRKCSWPGVPREVRPVTWRLLSGYLPANTERRKLTLQRKREEYFGFIEQYYDSRNEEHHQDTYRQIHIDIPRTNPLIPLFQQPLVQEIFERILFIWAIRHPASGYVQGINDLVTPFFVVFLSEYVEEDVENFDVTNLSQDMLRSIEADSFWCMSKLLDGIQDNYTFAQPGIQKKVKALEELVSRIDEQVHNHFRRYEVEYLQFAFRWMNNLLMRELPLRCTIRLWDTYQSEPEGFSHFHLYVCAAFLIKWRKEILDEEDFQGLLMLLQNLPTIHWGNEEIGLLLAEAYRLKYMFADAPNHYRR